VSLAYSGNRGSARQSGNYPLGVSASAGYRRYSTKARVRKFSIARGWGVLDSLNGSGSGIWFHFSVIDVVGYKTLDPGTLCDVEVETAEQDGFHLRALTVRPHS
jgi:cold shock CspA family protein